MAMVQSDAAASYLNCAGKKQKQGQQKKEKRKVGQHDALPKMRRRDNKRGDETRRKKRGDGTG